MIRKPLINRSSGRGLQTAHTATQAAPIGGWNARDPVAAMPAKDALVLENWFPKAGNVTLRPGAVEWATGFTENPLTLMPWNGGSSAKLFAATPTKIVEVDGGPISGTALASLTSGYLSFTNFQVSGGQYLLAVNGIDFLQMFDGSIWRQVNSGTGSISTATCASHLVTVTTSTNHGRKTGDSLTIAGLSAGYSGTWAITVVDSTHFTFTSPSLADGTATGTGTWQYNGVNITGVATNTLTQVAVACRRLWFVQSGTSSAWYLPTAQIGGALTEFPLGSIFLRGGTLVAIGTWTVDGGDGSDDYTVFISSEGEVAVYKGTDPSGISSFAKVGVFYVGEPLGNNCFCKYGGDLLILCQNGLFPLSKAMQSASINRTQTLTAKIDTAFTEAATLYGANPGWQAVVFPQGNLLIVNIPITASYTVQYVMNTITGAWCKFTGWLAFSWAVFETQLYFASDTKVAHAWQGTSDFGAAIVGRAQAAYNSFGAPARQKHFKLVRPLVTIDGEVVLQVGFDMDYAVSDFSSLSTLTPANGYLWDDPGTKWDSVTWGSDSESRREWMTVFSSEGYAAAFRLQTSTTSVSIEWSATDYIFSVGGIL